MKYSIIYKELSVIHMIT